MLLEKNTVKKRQVNSKNYIFHLPIGLSSLEKLGQKVI